MFSRIVSSLSTALDFNLATLSGSIDIIVVPDDHGKLQSTPFHVRFGKTKVLRSREKEVSIAVNGCPTPVKMTLGHAGEAYFKVPRSSVDRSTLCRRTSQSAQSNPTEVSVGGRYTDTTGPTEVSEEQTTERKIQISLCGHLLDGTGSQTDHDEDVFRANILERQAFEHDPNLWYHPSLVFRFGPSPSPYLPARVALPLIASWATFNKSLGKAPFIHLLHSRLKYRDPNMDVKRHLGLALESFSPTPRDQFYSTLAQPEPLNICARIFDSCCSPKKIDSHGLDVPLLQEGQTEFEPSGIVIEMAGEFVKSLKPTPEQLDLLKLKSGANRITFTVDTSLQGVVSVCCTIYLWPRDAKIVVSDVDGTITKSDVWGQLMPIIKSDWSHEGVAALFTNIERRQYHIVYLTARAIGQADATRDYLFGLSQENGYQMPDGPLIMSPDRLFSSFKREVIDREPFIFKIAALRDLRSLFSKNHNPFYAGFGNRDTDHRAYVNVGIPEARIFIVDTESQVHHVNQTFARTYGSMSGMISELFPPAYHKAGDPEPIRGNMSESTVVANSEASRDELSAEAMRALRKFKRLQSLEYMARKKVLQCNQKLAMDHNLREDDRYQPQESERAIDHKNISTVPSELRPRPRSSGATLTTRVKHALRT